MKDGKWPWLTLMVLFTAGVLWTGRTPVLVFTVRLPQEEHRLVGAVHTREGEEARLSYRHSVEKSAVEGRFVIAAGPCLRIRETRMASVGTGLPNTAPDRTRREGEWMVVDEGMQRIDNFRFRLVDLNRTRLTVEDAAIPLGGIRNGSILLLDVESVRSFRWWMWCLTGTDWESPNRQQEGIRETTG
jgi:hypothetical protein